MGYTFEGGLPAFHVSTTFTIGAIVVMLISLISMCVLFTKAGRPGWYAIVPFFNVWKEFEIIAGSGWKCLLMLIPLIGQIYMLVAIWKLSKAYGYGFLMFLLLLICSPLALLILAFGPSRYCGPQ